MPLPFSVRFRTFYEDQAGLFDVLGILLSIRSFMIFKKKKDFSPFFKRTDVPLVKKKSFPPLIFIVSDIKLYFLV